MCNFTDLRREHDFLKNNGSPDVMDQTKPFDSVYTDKFNKSKFLNEHGRLMKSDRDRRMRSITSELMSH